MTFFDTPEASIHENESGIERIIMLSRWHSGRCEEITERKLKRFHR